MLFAHVKIIRLKFKGMEAAQRVLSHQCCRKQAQSTAYTLGLSQVVLVLNTESLN